MTPIELVTAVVNFVALLLFVGLVSATLGSMLRRALLFRRAHKPIGVILRRGLALYTALTIVMLETFVLRVLGVELDEVTRLIFIVQADAILFAGLGYYAKVELFDIDDPKVD